MTGWTFRITKRLLRKTALKAMTFKLGTASFAGLTAFLITHDIADALEIVAVQEIINETVWYFAHELLWEGRVKTPRVVDPLELAQQQKNVAVPGKQQQSQ